MIFGTARNEFLLPFKKAGFMVPIAAAQDIQNKKVNAFGAVNRTAPLTFIFLLP
ncbi:MAG: hypothetical protein LUD44_03215 [Firmicutes bacterium]|nr:hypothetical protein [Bacillota bacterium]